MCECDADGGRNGGKVCAWKVGGENGSKLLMTMSGRRGGMMNRLKGGKKRRQQLSRTHILSPFASVSACIPKSSLLTSLSNRAPTLPYLHKHTHIRAFSLSVWVIKVNEDFFLPYRLPESVKNHLLAFLHCSG